MNRALWIILVPAAIVAAVYLALGLRPPWMRVGVLLAALVAVIWLAQRKQRKT